MKKILGLLLMCLLLCSAYGVINSMEASTAWHREEVIVHSGDTLWSIAGRWTDEKEDVREVLYRIREANKLNSVEYLKPGQKLIVPVRVTNSMLAQR